LARGFLQQTKRAGWNLESRMKMNSLLSIEKANGKPVTYLVRCADGTLYCGWTNHVDKRIKAHNEGKGAKYTRSRRPVKLVYFEVFETKEEAMRREAAIKKLAKKDKERLVSAERNQTQFSDTL
jgi:putative endonuclease